MDIKIKNKESGFLQLILIIIIVIFLLSYFHVSVSQAIDWLKNLFNNIK